MSADPFRLVLVESPFKGATAADQAANIEFARACMADCLSRGEAPFASHLLYPQPGVLDDGDPEERSLGIDAGLDWGAHAQASIFYLDRGISEGMRIGLDNAIKAQRHCMPRWIGTRQMHVYHEFNSLYNALRQKHLFGGLV